MHDFLAILPGPVWAQLWQITILILLVAVLSRLFARNRPYLAHALWLVVLLKCVTPPVFASPTGVFCWLQPRAVVESREIASPKRLSMADVEDTTSESRILSASVRTERVSILELTPGNEPATDCSDDAAVGAGNAGMALGDGAGAPGLREMSLLDTGNEPSVGRWAGWFAVLAAIWILGTVGIVVGTGLWFAVGLRRLRRDGCRVDRPLQRATTLLARRLGLRRRVRLVVTESRVGPAVFGLIRPTVLLPEVIVAGRSADELEPILAHELLHIRRGDLWVGLLQTLAQAVWWFHPLVWWAGRLAYREAERCCDEAVVAELGCPPGRYARSLLEVLARKQDLRLRPLPALPGVRPVELTSKRMERIMRLGQGSHRRSPWWCWAIMAMVAAASLPGAARMVKAERGASREGPGAAEVSADGLALNVDEAKDDTVVVGTKDTPLRAAPPLAAPAPQTAPAVLVSDTVKSPYACAYSVGDLLAVIRDEFDLEEEEAKKRLEGVLSTPTHVTWTQPAEEVRFAWSGDTLVATASEESHCRIVEAAKTMRTHGLARISIETRFVSVPPGVLDAADIEWTSVFEKADLDGTQTLVDPAADNNNRPPSAEGGSARVRTIREKRFPVRFAVLDENAATALTDQLLAMKGHCREPESLGRRVKRTLGLADEPPRQTANILQAPKVTCFNGQEAVVADCSQSPFVVDIKTVAGELATANQPVIRIVEEGTRVWTRPELVDDDHVRLESRLRFSHIDEVQTVTTKPMDRDEPVTVQVPEVETTEIMTNVKLGVGETLLVEGPRWKDEFGRPMALLVMLTPTEVVPAKKDPVYTIVYDVADLVVPIPDFVSNTGERVGGKEFMKAVLKMQKENEGFSEQCDAGFQTLIDLITFSIRPHTWKHIGGLGSIEPYRNNLTLVVKQSDRVHTEIVELLTQLRRLQNVQITLEVRRIDMTGGLFKRSGIGLDAEKPYAILNPREASLLSALAGNTETASLLQCPRVSLFNGQSAFVGLFQKQNDPTKDIALLHIEPASGTCLTAYSLLLDAGQDVKSALHQQPFEVHNVMLGVRAIASSNRDSVRLEPLIGYRNIPIHRLAQIAMPDGHTAVYDVTGLVEPRPIGPERGVPVAPDSKVFKTVPRDTQGLKVLLLITPRIIVREEEEEQVGSSTAGRVETTGDVGMVKPRIIIQDGEEERIDVGPEGAANPGP